jgi:3-isopropylmalate/(R)-2-methylmalate dehydratase small subunit
MANVIRGKAYVCGDNMDTDQIIPAEYLSYNPTLPEERKFFGMYAMSGVPAEESGLPKGNIPFVKDGAFKSEFVLIVGGKNFGCGSSREHAPLAIAEAGLTAMVAESYARIFYRNCVNGGYLRPYESAERLRDVVKTGDEVELDLDRGVLRHDGKDYTLSALGDAEDIINAGGIFNYARQTGMLPA